MGLFDNDPRAHHRREPRGIADLTRGVLPGAGLYYADPTGQVWWLTDDQQRLDLGEPYIPRPERDQLIARLGYVLDMLQQVTDRENDGEKIGTATSRGSLLRDAFGDEQYEHLRVCATCRKNAERQGWNLDGLTVAPEGVQGDHAAPPEVNVTVLGFSDRQEWVDTLRDMVKEVKMDDESVRELLLGKGNTRHGGAFGAGGKLLPRHGMECPECVSAVENLTSPDGPPARSVAGVFSGLRGLREAMKATDAAADAVDAAAVIDETLGLPTQTSERTSGDNADDPSRTSD